MRSAEGRKLHDTRALSLLYFFDIILRYNLVDIILTDRTNSRRYRAPEWREGRLCVLMELCDGGCVDTLLRHYGALRWNIVARYARSLPLPSLSHVRARF